MSAVGVGVEGGVEDDRLCFWWLDAGKGHVK